VAATKIEGASVLDKMWWFCKNAISSEDRNALEEVIAKHGEEVRGVECLDRLGFRRTLRSISYPEGILGATVSPPGACEELGRQVLRVSEKWQPARRAKAEALRRPMK
jgi:hypothetical protein